MPRLSRRLCWTLAASLSSTLLAGATELSLEVPSTIGQDRITLVATGSSLPEPLYVGWADEYRKQNPLVVDSLSAARHRLRARKASSPAAAISAAATRRFPTSNSKPTSRSFSFLRSSSASSSFTTCPTLSGDLRLTGPVVAEIFLGKIKTWNDPAIAKLNPDMKLPAQPIHVIHRTEGKGSNYILADYLCKVSPDFLAKAGRGESPNWPVGTSAARSQDMSDRVRATQYSIGYSELNLAERASLRVARIKNSANEFVKPTEKTFANAALEAKISDDFRVSLTNAPGKDSYPITSFTWFYVPAKAKDPSRGRAVAAYLNWIYTDGQQVAQDKGYATLPKELLAKVTATAATIR